MQTTEEKIAERKRYLQHVAETLRRAKIGDRVSLVADVEDIQHEGEIADLNPEGHEQREIVTVRWINERGEVYGIWDEWIGDLNIHRIEKENAAELRRFEEARAAKRATEEEAKAIAAAELEALRHRAEKLEAHAADLWDHHLAGGPPSLVNRPPQNIEAAQSKAREARAEYETEVFERQKKILNQ